MFRIYYRDEVYEGNTGREWNAAPKRGVQVVALFGERMKKGTPHELWQDRFQTGFTACGREDRQLFCGVNQYDQLGWGVKFGSLLPDPEFQEVWSRARGDD